MKLHNTPGKLITSYFVDSRPVTLLLGQDSWSSASSGDPVLELAMAKAGSTSNARGWQRLIGPTPLTADFYRYLAELFARRPEPEWLSLIAKLPWSAIFTSSLDPTLRRALRSQNREPQVILTAAEAPLAKRSTARTPIYYLFSQAGIEDIRALPPRTRNEFRVRLSVDARPMLNRLFEATTALGLLIIDGYSIGRDWLDFDDLLAVIHQFPSGSVLWCGYPDSSSLTDETNGLGMQVDELRELENSGRIVTARGRLSTVLAELEVSQGLEQLTSQVVEEKGKITFGRGLPAFEPSAELRIRVEAVAAIIDDAWLAFQTPLAGEARYAAFRDFHGSLAGPRSLIDGVRSGFAITRSFENDLGRLVRTATEEHSRIREPVIVHGQSGTGKSISLARLAIRTREIGAAAVLYTDSRVPQSVEIDSFCEQAEQNGAVATLVVCDCHAAIERYRDLLHGLRSRGRKVVVIGSTYRLPQLKTSENEPYFLASEELSTAEKDSLLALLCEFDPNLKDVNVATSNFLALLYRHLPASRSQLAFGLGREARSAERALRERGRESVHIKPRSALAVQLLELGLVDPSTAILDDVFSDSALNSEDSAGRLIDLVMTPGRLGCSVPVNLLVRAVRSASTEIDVDTIARLFRGLDLFRWREVGGEGEELLVGPRLRLEADLICRRRLADPKREGELLVTLVKSVRPSYDALNAERRFLLDLIQALAPDGPMKTLYSESYISIARALTELRQLRGIDDPSLMLQESFLRRAAIKSQNYPASEKVLILDEAREAVQTALDLSATGNLRVSALTRAHLSNERAAIYGFLAKDRAEHGGNETEVWTAYQAARSAARAAVGLSDTYHPLDVSIWIPSDLLRSNTLSEPHRLELVADIHSVLDGVDGLSLAPDQRERFESRRLGVGQLLGSSEMTETAFKALDSGGSAAGYYLRARSIGPDFSEIHSSTLDKRNIDKASRAQTFLREHWPRVKTDERCVRYLLRCEWAIATGTVLFRGDRAPLPHSDADRRRLLDLVQIINEVTAPVYDNALRYLEGVLFWLTGEDRTASDLFQQLREETNFVDVRRVVRRNVITNEDGTAQRFSGRIESQLHGGRYKIRIDGLNRLIPMLEQDFEDQQLEYGRAVPSFSIAFNYIGPIADPLVKKSKR